AGAKEERGWSRDQPLGDTEGEHGQSTHPGVHSSLPLPRGSRPRGQPSIREKSATARTASRKRASRSSRAARLFGSSSFTVTSSKNRSIGARSEASARIARSKSSASIAAAASGSAESSAAISALSAGSGV